MESVFVSGENVADNASMNIGQSVVTARVTIGQTRMIDAEQVQDCGVEVVDVDTISRHCGSDLVRSAVRDATFDATSRQPR